MRNLILLFTLSLISVVPLSAQSSSDSIQTVKKAMGTLFVQNGKRLTPSQLTKITKTNTEAYKEMKTANINYTFAIITGGVGGFMVGYPLGTALGGGDPNWVMVGIGAALIVVSIPLNTGYSRHATNAVDIYNSGLPTAQNEKLDIHLCLTGNGIGLQMRF